MDIFFPQMELQDLPDLFLTALRFKFGGVGIYPYWTLQNRRLGGLHLDVRVEPRIATWLAEPSYNDQGKAIQQYLPASFGMLTRHFQF